MLNGKVIVARCLSINGPEPWDIHVKNERFYSQMLFRGDLGFGESYMNDWWNCAKLDECVYKILTANIETKVLNNKIVGFIHTLLTNQQSKSRAFVVGQHHYDIGNDLYSLMLDKRLTYTCGYWKNASGLDQAQEQKLKLVCDKLNLQPGQRVLDIGCGWGSFAKYAAENYGVSVVGITVSKRQIELGQQLCHGLPVELRYQDYRDVNDQFDHIVSLGMFEHVGYKNYRHYMQVVQRNLKTTGSFLLHTIGNNVTTRVGNPWINQYIFPNSLIPSMKQITTAFEGIFVMEDWHNFGFDYSLTLKAWHENFIANWSNLKKKYGEQFYRMWNFYLLSCAGAFRARSIQLWQIVLSKRGAPEGYHSIR